MSRIENTQKQLELYLKSLKFFDSFDGDKEIFFDHVKKLSIKIAGLSKTKVITEQEIGDLGSALDSIYANESKGGNKVYWSGTKEPFQRMCILLSNIISDLNTRPTSARLRIRDFLTSRAFLISIVSAFVIWVLTRLFS